MLLVVPLAAYRSLEGEIDDGTLELLSITTLSPWQIVLGKLASAMLQMVLYYVALFPCVAYAYTLRGVDLPTTLLMMAILVVAAVLLTVVALFFAPLSRTRTGRITTLLAVMSILLASEWGLAVLVISMICTAIPLIAELMFFLRDATLLISLSLGTFTADRDGGPVDTGKRESIDPRASVADGADGGRPGARRLCDRNVRPASRRDHALRLRWRWPRFGRSAAA